MKKWELLHSEQLIKDKWSDVRKNSYKKNDGSVIEPFYNYGFPDNATALAITKRGTVIVERIYRPGIDEIILELPGGCVDPTDTMLETAIERELLEETGLVAKEWIRLFEMHLSNSVSDELAVIYLARDLTQFEAEPEETEQLQVKKIPFAAMLDMVEEGEITDSMTVAAVYKVQLLLLQGKLN